MFLTKLWRARNVVNNLVCFHLCKTRGYFCSSWKCPCCLFLWFFVFSLKSAHHLTNSRGQDEIWTKRHLLSLCFKVFFFAVHLHGWLRWSIRYNERILLCACAFSLQNVDKKWVLRASYCFLEKKLQSEVACSWRHSSFDREKNGEKTEAKGQPRGGKFQTLRKLVNLKSRCGDIELSVVFIRRGPVGAV